MVDNLCMKIRDLTGQAFGRLTVQERAEMPANVCHKRAYWRCICSCGGETVRAGDALGGGKAISCGCHVKDRLGPRFRHGHSDSPTYTSWSNMIRRCEDARHPSFDCYGGRGITVCARWRQDFAAFLADMGERPVGKTLDRYPNNDGNYEPGNCRWATPKEQRANSHSQPPQRAEGRRIFWQGEELTVKEWARKLGIPIPTLHKRLANNYPTEMVLAPGKFSSNQWRTELRSRRSEK